MISLINQERRLSLQELGETCLQCEWSDRCGTDGALIMMIPVVELVLKSLLLWRLMVLQVCHHATAII